MPTRVCSTPGCPAFDPCPHHPKHRAPDTRPSAFLRGYGPKWRAYSEAYRKAHPRCRPCQAQGRNTPTDAVDHIHPVTGPSDPLFWKHSNHQPICHSCHSAKTKAEGKTQLALATHDSISWGFA
jgi:5-methylcytosine-specific restriction protein A